MYRCNKLNESRKAWDVIPHGGQIKTSLRQRLAHLLPVAPWQCKKALRLLIDVESNETEAYKYVSASQSDKEMQKENGGLLDKSFSDYSLYKQGKLARRTNGKWNLILLRLWSSLISAASRDFFL